MDTACLKIFILKISSPQHIFPREEHLTNFFFIIAEKLQKLPSAK